MATMNISLPDKMKEWVEAQVATGRYANASDYVRDLLRGDQERMQFPSEIEAAVGRALAAREDPTAFVAHGEAMDRLDAEIDAVVGRRNR